MSGTLAPISGVPNVAGIGPDMASALFGFPPEWLPYVGLIMGVLLGILIGFHLAGIVRPALTR